MKRTTLLTAIICTLFVVFSNEAQAQKFAKMDVSPMDAATYPSSYRESSKLIKIVYSRPQLKGRELSNLVPNGEVWRTGANEAAELTLYTDMKLGDTVVKAGTYSFFTIPGDKEWTAIISTDINVWGAYSYDESNDVARLKVPVSEGSKSIEAFSISFDKSDAGVDMHMGWGTARVTVPFTK